MNKHAPDTQGPSQSALGAPLEIEPQIPALKQAPPGGAAGLALPAVLAAAGVHMGLPALLSLASFGSTEELFWTTAWLECIRDTGWRSTLGIFLIIVALRR
ncbi:MAG TPA: hypothetical protein EYQ25_08025 [Planctomycetes bacterium]|nr:hypothetical protein [Planctomycetota bacterium]HIL36615.1 hypothetical protein [Planctomycetota bacterium]